LDKAIVDYNKSIELNPSFLKAAYARAACENKRGSFD
jgi:hypothetical protein